MKSWIRLCRKLNIWILSILMLLFSPLCVAFASEAVTEQETIDTELPAYPYLSIEITVMGEMNEEGCFLQNWDDAAQYPIADITQTNYLISITNEGEAELEEPVTTVWTGEFCSTFTGTDGVTIPPKDTVVSKRSFNIDEHDVESGSMLLRVELTAKCTDPAYEKTVTVSDEITIDVCARPEEEIVAYLETAFDGGLSKEELTDYYRTIFGQRYEQMKARVEPEGTEETTEEPGVEVIPVLLAGAVCAVSASIVCLLWKKGKRK